MNPTDIAAALKTALSTLDGFAAYDFIPAQPTPPSIWVYPEDITYHPSSSDVWCVQAVVSANVLEQAAQQRLATLLGTEAGSVVAAVEAEPTLDGTVDDVIVVEAKGFQVFDLPALGVALGSTWTLNIVTTD